MDKLQEAIDSALGKEAERVPSHPSDAFLERARVFDEKAKKIELLRQARLQSERADRNSATFIFEVVRHRGYWRVLFNGEHSAPYPNQSAAVRAAKGFARKKRDLGHAIEVRLVRTDGRIVTQSLDRNA